VEGVTNYTGRVKESFPHCFDAPGIYTVKGTLLRESRELIAHSIAVKVVGAQFNGQPACWVGTPRKWDCPALPAETVIEKDPRLVMETLEGAQGGREFSLVDDAAEPRHAVARLGTNGPVLAHARAEGFRIYASRELSTYIERAYPDGSRLVATELLASPVLIDVTVRVDIFVGGVTFDDGTITKTLTASDFDELGMHILRFIRPATAQTSICHTTKVFQGDVLIKQY